MATSPVVIDNVVEDPRQRAPLVLGDVGFHDVTESVCTIAERPTTPRAWYIAFAVSLALTGVLGAMLAYLISTGVGVWGNNVPVAWGFPIVNFVFWVGIGHAGTLISAILFLFRQKWRTSINRSAEAMTIFAVICAGIFPAVHIGRVWFAYWLFPLPNQMQMWPNFRSPLVWDVFAVSTYATVSMLFWYMGMVPDLATLRDRAKGRIAQIAYGIFALGWTGSNRNWLNFERAYLLLAALATPLVLSVHSVVSFDFAVSIVPGWHTTIFPPYFVAGAIFSGFGMVLTLLIPSRKFFGLGHLITPRHIENMAKVVLATGSMVGYAYIIEFFIAWYGGNLYELFAFKNRALGPYWWAYWIMFGCNVITPQLFWIPRMRRSMVAVWILSIFVNIGMWFERFVIVVTSLSRDFLPSSWDYFKPTWVDILTFVGSFGLFMTLFLLFVRFLPMVAMAEVKSVMPQATHGALEHGHRPLGDYWPDMPHHEYTRQHGGSAVHTKRPPGGETEP
jgi:molybdopterin-containing oxidoreductase family membrane subunit